MAASRKQSGGQDVSDRALRRGYWIASNRSSLRLWSEYALMGVAGILFLVFFVVLLQWVLNIAPTQAIRAGVSTSAINPDAVAAPVDIQVVRALAVRRDDASVDAVIELANVNRTWGASTLEYEVLIGGSAVETTPTTLAPGQSKALALTNIEFAGTTVPRVSVVVSRTEWGQYPDEAALPQNEWEFSSPSLRLIDAEESAFQTELQLTVRNKSVYGFREPEVVVLMENAQSEVVAIGSVVMDKARSLEQRVLTFRWPQRYQRSLTPVAYVNVDMLTDSRIIRDFTLE